MTRRRSLLTMSATALLAAAMAGPVMAQSPSFSASAPAASIPAGPAITVIATDYHFGNLPTTVPVGTTIALENQGLELHEIIVVRKNDGVTQTWEELLAMPDDTAFQYVSIVGGVPLFASPGETAEGSIPVSQTGEYIAICFVPQGTTSMEPPPSTAPGESAAPQGPPHFVLGMIQEFTATEAGTEVGPLPSMAPIGSGTPAESGAP